MKKYLFLIFVLFAISFSAYALFSSPLSKFKFNYYTEEELLNKCNYDNLLESSYCVSAFMNGFYKYKLGDDSVELTFEELKSLGGDCSDWSNWLKKIYSEMGFYSNTITFQTRTIQRVENNYTINHVMAYAISENHFCLYEGPTPICGENQNNEEDIERYFNKLLEEKKFDKNG